MIVREIPHFHTELPSQGVVSLALPPRKLLPQNAAAEEFTYFFSCSVGLPNPAGLLKNVAKNRCSNPRK